MKGKEREAEVAAENFIRIHFKCDPTYRAVRTKYSKVDIMACDVVGKQPNGTTLWVQVTTGAMGAVNARKRKLIKINWNPWDRVLMIQMKEGKDGRKKVYGFQVWELEGFHASGSRTGHRNKWVTWDGLQLVPREWFRVGAKEKE